MGIFLGWLILSIIVACIASSKGRSGFGWFCLSMLISPLISLIILLCVGDSQDKQEDSIKRAMRVIEKEKNKTEQNKVMPQDKALEDLQRAKKMLELGVISQEEYEIKKAELMPILRNDVPLNEKTIDIAEDSKMIVTASRNTDKSHLLKGGKF
ncbi:MAG: SHOCT domain-containing protein [Paludibacteraceae bacterium]|nr:SHOCT domain-containing protein [Paludibacteraceae bacterium]